MTKDSPSSTHSKALDAPLPVTVQALAEAFDAVQVGVERFCPSAGIAALQEMVAESDVHPLEKRRLTTAHTHGRHWTRPVQPPAPTSLKGAQKIGWAYRERLEAVIVSRISAQKHVWWARIVLLSANGVGAMGFRRRTGKGPECLGIGLKPRSELCAWADITGQTAQQQEDPAGPGVGWGHESEHVEPV